MKPPFAKSGAGLDILRSFIAKGPLGALRKIHSIVGNIFQIKLPGFNPVFLAGPAFAKQVLVSNRKDFQWRNETDPVAKLLRHGFLVEDDNAHIHLRELIQPGLKRSEVKRHVPKMIAITDQVSSEWPSGQKIDMLTEMRKISILIIVDTLFGIDVTSDLAKLWPHILGVIKYISPGPWLIFPNAPRPGYQDHINAIDAFLFESIEIRRVELQSRNRSDEIHTDVLDRMIMAGLDNDLIRDQMLTLFIAGHDTNTAHLAWTLYELGIRSDVQSKVAEEVDSTIGSSPTYAELDKLTYLDGVINESLRLHPPIHVSNRISKCPVNFGEYTIPEKSRTMFSIYLTHRDAEHWPDADSFCPERFSDGSTRKPFSYLPFGGGPRNCIGAIYAKVEARAVLSRLIQQFEFKLASPNVRDHMGATLEPKPGVMMSVTRRS